MSDTTKTPINHLAGETAGHPAYPLAKVQAHALQPIDKQASDTHQALRSMADVLAKRCLRYSLSVSKKDARNLHALAQTMNIAYQAAYHGADNNTRGPQHVLIQLFGSSGAGVAIARNLQSMLPVVEGEIVDTQPVPPQGGDDTSSTSD